MRGNTPLFTFWLCQITQMFSSQSWYYLFWSVNNPWIEIVDQIFLFWLWLSLNIELLSYPLGSKVFFYFDLSQNSWLSRMLPIDYSFVHKSCLIFSSLCSLSEFYQLITFVTDYDYLASIGYLVSYSLELRSACFSFDNLLYCIIRMLFVVIDKTEWWLNWTEWLHLQF